MAGRFHSIHEKFCDNFLITEYTPASVHETFQDIATRVVKSWPKRLLVLARSNHEMENQLTISKVKKYASDRFVDADFISKQSGRNFTDLLFFSPSITVDSINSYRRNSWLLATNHSNKKLQELMPLLSSIFDNNDVKEQVGTLLSFFDLCIRVWPWEPETMIQLFYKPDIRI